MALMVQCLACKGEKCDQCDQQGWVMQYDLILRDVKSSVDTGNVTDSSQRVTGVCPNCEAAARERDAAYEDSRQMQNRLQRLIDGKPQQDVIDALNALCDKQSALLSRVAVVLRGPEPPLTKWGHHDLAERAAKAVHERDDLRAGILRVIEDYPRDIKQDAEEALRALADGVAAPMSSNSDLRARLAALADRWDSERAEWVKNGVLNYSIALERTARELRAELRKEAK